MQVQKLVISAKHCHLLIVNFCVVVLFILLCVRLYCVSMGDQVSVLL